MKTQPSDSPVEYGVMAQEVEQIFPELVKTAENEMKTKSVNYIGFIAPMIETIRQLKSEQETLKQELKQLQAQLKEQTPRRGLASLSPTADQEVERLRLEQRLFMLIVVVGFVAFVLRNRVTRNAE